MPGWCGPTERPTSSRVLSSSASICPPSGSTPAIRRRSRRSGRACSPRTSTRWWSGRTARRTSSRAMQYMRYDIARNKVDPGFPAPIAGNWPGMPDEFASGIDEAVVWNDGTAYFFKGCSVRPIRHRRRPGRVGLSEAHRGQLARSLVRRRGPLMTDVEEPDLLNAGPRRRLPTPRPSSKTVSRCVFRAAGTARWSSTSACCGG